MSTQELARESVDAFNGLYGTHEGARALHAKGILTKGTFTATARAAELCTAAHMQGEPVAATVRFSNGGGNPHHPDFLPDVRGLAAKLYLPGGKRTDLVMATLKQMPVRTAQEFLELARAGTGRSALWQMPAFLARHPHLVRPLLSNATIRPPASYAACTYAALHAYVWIAPDGSRRGVRYRFLPEREERPLSPIAARRAGSGYLAQELKSRLEGGPVRFTLEVQVAEPGDPLDDATKAWPSERERFAAGTLEVTALETEREQDGDVLVFDPTRVPDGIELSDDPVLRFRTHAYSESVERRTGRQRPEQLA